jgi:hypothetical protein
MNRGALAPRTPALDEYRTLEYVLLPAHRGQVLEVPPCVRVDIGTSEVLGIARPN